MQRKQWLLTLCLLVSSVDNHCKQIEPRLGPTKTSGLIWIQILWHSDDIPERTFWKKWEKNQQTKKPAKLPSRQRVNNLHAGLFLSFFRLLISFSVFFFLFSRPGVTICRAWNGSKPFARVISRRQQLELAGKELTHKVPITTAADGNFCRIFPNFQKKSMIFHENRLPSDDSHELSCLICYF